MRIRDRDTFANAQLGIADIIYQEYFPGATTSFTVPSGLIGTGHNYSLEIDPVDLRGTFIPGTGNTGGRQGEMFSDTLRQSRAFFNFSQLSGTVPPEVYLPTPDIQPNGIPAYNFSITNVGGQTVFIDPLIAIGYDYEIGTGDPNFASVLLPTGIGDNLYEIILSGLSSVMWQGGVEFDFTSLVPTGVSSFGVRGIEASAGLSPFDATAFITGLTFVGQSNFTGRMIPIAVNIPTAEGVPEPATLFLLGLGLVGLGGLAWRRNLQR